MTEHTMPARANRDRPVGRSPLRLLTVGLAAAGLLVGACGSTDADDTTVGVADLPAADSDDGQAEAEPGVDQDGGGGGDAGPPELTEDDIEAANLAFEQCMADAGIDVSGLFGDGDGEVIGDETGGVSGQIDAEALDDDDFQASMDECNKIFDDTFGSFEPSPEDQARLADAEAAFANCMAEAGFEFPEDDGGGVISFEMEDGEADFDALDEAIERCSTEAFGEDGLILSESEAEEG